MGSESEKQIPIIEVSKEMERGSQEWSEVSKRVREACEEYGCFEVICDQIPSQLREEIFSVMNKLYELPMDTKKKNTNSNAFMAYASPNPVIPLLESFGIEDASNHDSIKAFAQMMMSHDPLAQAHFCKIFNNLMKPLDDLHKRILNLIVDSYGVGDKAETVETMATQILVRTMKYKPPPPGQDILGAYAHTDKPLCTLLCEDQSGLEISTKDGEYFLWIPTHPNSFIFNVGDPLMVWSNGRLHSMKHRVVTKGRDKERHSIAAFLFPVKSTIIKTQEELIDEDHPRIFKPFDHSEYLKFCTSIDPTVESDRMVYKFAGI